jgi:H+/gluconate symporter-like permease
VAIPQASSFNGHPKLLVFVLVICSIYLLAMDLDEVVPSFSLLNSSRLAA